MIYLVAYGHAIRCEKAESVPEAMRLAFGIVNNERMTLTAIPKLPRLMKPSLLKFDQTGLAVRHFLRIGSVLSGREKDLTYNYHWRACDLCKHPILTEKIKEPEEQCSSCLAKLATLSQEDIDKSSIMNLRKKLCISLHATPAFEETKWTT